MIAPAYSDALRSLASVLVNAGLVQIATGTDDIAEILAGVLAQATCACDADTYADPSFHEEGCPYSSVVDALEEAVIAKREGGGQ